MSTPEERLLDSILSRSYEIEESLPFDESFEDDLYPVDPDGFENPLVDEEDRDILMHRDAHFAGNFDLMIEAYMDEKKSAVLDTSMKRIQTLARQEQELQRNIAAILLSGPDAEKIAFSRKMYRDLSALFDNPQKSLPKAVAGLILTESEHAEEEIDEVCSYGKAAIEPLLEIVESPLFTDPLFPGYGEAPLLAARALALLQAGEAVMPILYLIKEAPHLENELVTVLHAIGPTAKVSLMKLAEHYDDTALQALLAFPDHETAAFCFRMLKSNPDHPAAPYFVLGCEHLNDQEKQEFTDLLKSGKYPAGVLEEMRFLTSSWNK